jgi:hypothetical protein
MTSVAGDFYDYIVADDYQAGLLIADVSGHGVPAALLTRGRAGAGQNQPRRQWGWGGSRIFPERLPRQTRCVKGIVGVPVRVQVARREKRVLRLRCRTLCGQQVRSG